MEFEYHSYRFAQEILQHENHLYAWNEIEHVLRSLPLFIYPGKSRNKAELDVSQQLLNTFLDRRFAIDFGWEYHPLATRIEGSKLAADFLKEFENMTIQAEVQFGNMARWYSDIFKFQTAYSQGLIDVGLSIVPMFELAKRIDQNIANYERASRELPSAKLSITLPILLIGLYPGEDTKVVDLRECGFDRQYQITANTNQAKLNRYRIVNGYLEDIPMSDINGNSPTGNLPEHYGEDIDDDGE